MHVNSAVTVYTTPTCAYCHMAKEYLASKGVTFNEINIADANNEEALNFVVTKTGQAATPYIMIGDEGILGFDRAKIDLALDKLKTEPPTS